MTPSRQKYSQFELFPAETPVLQTRRQPRFFIRRVTLSGENLVVMGIVLMITMVLSFSLGVEKGRRGVRASLQTHTRQVVKSETPPAAPAPAAAAPVVGAAVPPAAEPVQLAETLPAPTDSADPGQEKSVDKVYTIQVASFQKEKFAEKEAMRLKEQGYEIMVIPKGSHSIVCVGKFALKDQASHYLKELKKQYKDCLVRRL